MLVKQLMDEANKWNVNLIRNSFDVQVAEEILQIEVMQGSNVMVWKFERNELYLVASGYSIVFYFFYLSSSELLEHFSNKDLWRSGWTLRTLLKLKVLL